jgi:hypothetical protein
MTGGKQGYSIGACDFLISHRPVFAQGFAGQTAGAGYIAIFYFRMHPTDQALLKASIN